jgi:phospholipid/cholesterol/gamma-HCH transport system permease protein
MNLAGRLDAAEAARVWTGVLRAAGRGETLELAALDGCDTAGAALLAAARRRGAALHGASAEVVALMDGVAATPLPADPRQAYWTFRGVWNAFAGSVAGALAFVGEGAVATVRLPVRRRFFRLADLLRLADEAGARAVPLVLLMGFLMGLILTFQGSIPLRRFGADLFVVNLTALALLRELGPLLAGVILAGRTASAFAAELGTMKINEELAALATMGIDPMTMLVLPRMAAAILVMPVLTLLLEVAGLVGMFAVMLTFGFAPAAIGAQLLRAVHLRDLWGGLFKALCFGAAIAAIGCRSGLATGVGPRAVGLAVTSAVVGGIVAAVVLDGVFALAFYRLGV